MTIYLISPYEDFTAIVGTSVEALELITDHIGLHAVSRQQYARANAKLDTMVERRFASDAAYLRWRKADLSEVGMKVGD